MRQMTRRPTSPGEILKEEYLLPLGLTQKAFADYIGYDVKQINRVVNGRAAVTAEMALRLGAALGTSAEFWLNAQMALDLHRAREQTPRLPRPVRSAA